MRNQNKYTRKIPAMENDSIIFILLGLVVVLFRLPGVITAYHNLNSDQAMFLLMAKRILSGSEFPLFSWGNRYLGLTETWISLPVFYLFGTGPGLMAGAMVMVAVFTSWIIFYSFRSENRSLALYTSLAFAIGNSYVYRHGTDISGNFSVTVLFYFTGLFIIHYFYHSDWSVIRPVRLFALGTFVGLAFYTRQETAISSFWLFAIAGNGDLKVRLKRSGVVIAGIVTGFLPGVAAWFLPMTHKLNQVKPVLGFNPLPGADFVLKDIFPQMNFMNSVAGGLLLALLSGFGFYKSIRSGGIVSKQALYLVLSVVSVFYITGSSDMFNVERYYLLMVSGMTVGTGTGIYYITRIKKMQFALMVVLLAGFGVQNYRQFTVAKNDPPMKEVADWLVQEKLFNGMAEYWASLPVVWFSEDKVHFVTYLGVQRDIRGAVNVIESGVQFYLFQSDSVLEGVCRQELNSRYQADGYTTKTISGYTIFILKEKENPWGANRDIILREFGSR